MLCWGYIANIPNNTTWEITLPLTYSRNPQVLTGLDYRFYNNNVAVFDALPTKFSVKNYRMVGNTTDTISVFYLTIGY